MPAALQREKYRFHVNLFKDEYEKLCILAREAHTTPTSIIRGMVHELIQNEAKVREKLNLIHSPIEKLPIISVDEDQKSSEKKSSDFRPDLIIL